MRSPVRTSSKKKVKKKGEDFAILQNEKNVIILALKESFVRPELDHQGVSESSLRLEREQAVIRLALEITRLPHDFSEYVDALWRGTSLVQWHGSGLHPTGPFHPPGWDIPCYTVKLYSDLRRAQAPILSYDELQVCIRENDQNALERIAASNCYSTWRIEALRRIENQDLLHHLALQDCDDWVRYVAAEHLEDKSIQKKIDRQVRDWAIMDLKKALENLVIDKHTVKAGNQMTGKASDIVARVIPAHFSGRWFYQSGACRPISFDNNPSKERMEILLRTYKPWTNVINRVVLHIRRISPLRFTFWQTDVFLSDAQDNGMADAT
ncbi:MAG TPA: hypothetical protein VHO84_16725 [Syntrophorhabdaceae bacterium]|nr:hypothetical protein [Syntrophorhabdaceae bacterium]